MYRKYTFIQLILLIEYVVFHLYSLDTYLILKREIFSLILNFSYWYFNFLNFLFVFLTFFPTFFGISPHLKEKSKPFTSIKDYRKVNSEGEAETFSNKKEAHRFIWNSLRLIDKKTNRDVHHEKKTSIHTCTDFEVHAQNYLYLTIKAFYIKKK